MADRHKIDKTPEVSTGELFRRVADDMTLLAKKELELAKHESQADWHQLKLTDTRPDGHPCFPCSECFKEHFAPGVRH